MGAQAAESTSQTRNSSTPVAVAFSSARSVGAGLRSRPIGNPSRMVTPAMKPSSRVDIKLTKLPRLLRRAGLPRRQTSTQPRVCKTGTVDAVRQHQIARPGVGGARAVRVQQAGVKTDHSRPRQIGPRSVDGGSVSDSQADSAGSIPVT